MAQSIKETIPTIITISIHPVKPFCLLFNWVIITILTFILWPLTFVLYPFSNLSTQSTGRPAIRNIHLRYAPCTMRYALCPVTALRNLQQTTSNIQHTTNNKQRATYNKQRATYNLT